MDRHGSDALHTQELILDDILRGRIEFLISMANDFVVGNSLGNIQRKAIEKNAHFVETNCMASITAIGREPIDENVYLNIRFFYYLKSLAGMMKSTVQGVEPDEAGRGAIREHVDVLTEMLEDHDHINETFIENCLNLLLLKLVAVI